VVLILEEVELTTLLCNPFHAEREKTYLEDCSMLAFAFDYSVSTTAKGTQSEKDCLFERGRVAFSCSCICMFKLWKCCD